MRNRLTIKIYRYFLVSLLSLMTGSVAAQIGEEESKTLSSTDEMRAVSGALGDRESLPGAALFTRHCVSCHAGQVYKAPHTSWLEMMPARTLYTTMTEGVMQQQSTMLSDDEKKQVVEYLLQEPFTDQAQAPKLSYCSGKAARFEDFNPQELTGWGRDTARFVPAPIAGLSVADIPRLQLKWSFGFPNAMRARSQPAVAMGAVFVGSQDGTVYALDLETGCVRWAYQASAEVRTGIVPGQHGDGPPTVFFGDIIANLYAVNAHTGELLWRVSPDDHHSATLTGTPAYHDGTLYVPVSSLEVIPAAAEDYECCTFRGSVVAYNGADGTQRWQSYSIPTEPKEVARTSVGTRILSPSGAPVWSSPTLDPANNRLFFGTGENYSTPADDNSDAIIAVRMDTGKRIWKRQVFSGDAWNVACMMSVEHPNCPPEQGPDFDQGSSPLLIDAGKLGKVLVAGHKDGSVIAYDAEQGQKQPWVTRIGRGSIQGGVHFGMAAEGTRVYAPINDMNDTRNGDVLDPKLARPGLHAIDATNGKVLWSHIQENICGAARPFCDPGISAPVTALPGAVVAGHLDGHLRIYAGDTGKVLWDYDTAREFETVNGQAARGGGMSGAGPTLARGHLISNSGYGLYFHEPGNVLLVFSVDGK
ncbi:MAG: polyvinyl alcohol dehydrogenase (cytochrome) [Halioglobus sp.]|jgi:polyvinyl alcohol dehydrogenase (cytochrome)